MGELKKLTPQQLEELRAQLKKVQNGVESKEDHSNNSVIESKITVFVSKDLMNASVLLKDTGQEHKYSVEAIISELRKNKVVIGYKDEMISRLAKGELYDEEVVVAEGKPIIQGEDGHFDFFFGRNEKRTPFIRENGTVDYSAMGKLENVKAGDVIARYNPSKQGERGYTVTGAELIPKYVKDLQVLRGKNIERNEETNEYIAKVSGKISYSNGNIEILTVHEINGNVDLITGTIEFYGDIIISGNVEAGVVIRAGRNVTIKGTVSSAKIFAGGDIILQKGIQGGGKGKISARGSVYADFIEYTQVDAFLDVNANSIINSTVNASGQIILKGKRGSLIGGYSHGLKGITISNSGNLSESRTLLHAGFKEEDYETISDLLKEEHQLKIEVANIIGNMTNILQLRKVHPGSFSKQNKDVLFKLNTKKDEIYKRIDQIAKDKEELSKRMAIGQAANITVKGVVHIGTTISIDVARIIITRNESYVRFVCKNNIIERVTVPQDY